MAEIKFDEICNLPINQVKEKIFSLEDIPTLPSIATKLNKIVNNPDFTVEELCKVINLDQALATKLLKVANSASYNVSSEVDSLEKAVMRLGINEIKNIVTGVSIVNTFNSTDLEVPFDITDFWMHSLAVGFLNKKIATMLGIENLDDMWLCGLMHDIGKLIYLKYMPEVMWKILDESQFYETSFYEAEKKLLPISHDVVGKWLCDRWNIPKKFSIVIFNHHNPPANNAKFGNISDYIAITHISDQLIKLSRVGNSGDFTYKINPVIWNYVEKEKIDTKKIITRVHELRVEVKEILEFLS